MNLFYTKSFISTCGADAPDAPDVTVRTSTVSTCGPDRSDILLREPRVKNQESRQGAYSILVLDSGSEAILVLLKDKADSRESRPNKKNKLLTN